MWLGWLILSEDKTGCCMAKTLLDYRNLLGPKQIKKAYTDNCPTPLQIPQAPPCSKHLPTVLGFVTVTNTGEQHNGGKIYCGAQSQRLQSMFGWLPHHGPVRQNITAGGCDRGSPHGSQEEREQERGRGWGQDRPFKGCPYFLQPGSTLQLSPTPMSPFIYESINGFANTLTVQSLPKCPISWQPSLNTCTFRNISDSHCNRSPQM
jgi:hypothetical protein